MKVPSKKLSQWKKYSTHGDVKRLTSETGKSRPTITRALSGKSASPELIKTIDAFYEKRIVLVTGKQISLSSEDAI